MGLNVVCLWTFLSESEAHFQLRGEVSSESTYHVHVVIFGLFLKLARPQAVQRVNPTVEALRSDPGLRLQRISVNILTC